MGERLLIFHLQPAFFDGLLSLVAVLLFLRLFHVRSPSLRAFFLIIPLVRPLLVLLDCGSPVTHDIASGPAAGLRLTHLLPVISLDYGYQPVLYEESRTLLGLPTGIMVLSALLIAIASLFFLFRWIGFLVFSRRLRRQACAPEAEEDAWLQRLLRRLANELGLKNLPRIIYVESRDIYACAIGWRWPLLVVNPKILRELKPDELSVILAHELVHIKRRDSFWRWVLVLLRDTQFFNPLSSMALNRFTIEREKACDSAAVNALRTSPRVLAACLVEISRWMSQSRRRLTPVVSYLMSDRSSLMEGRIRHLMEMDARECSSAEERTAHRRRKASGTGLLIFAWLVLLLVQFYVFIPVGGGALIIK